LPRKRIAEIESLIRKQAANESNYSNLITQADALFESGKFNEAQAKYKEASVLKPQESYPKERMQQAASAWSSLQAEEKARQALNDQYVQAVAKANTAYAKRDYSSAATYYQQALELKPSEELPKTKLDEVKVIISRLEADAAEKKKTDDAYNDIVAKAETLFIEKQYEEAKQQYAAALALKPSEAYPKTRMTEIERTIQNEARDAETARLAKLDAEYKSVIAEADKLFDAKDYEGAKAAYARALTLKPSDTYPAQRTKSIDNLVSAQKASQLKAIEDGYANAVAEAERALSNNLFAEANQFYKKALEFKPGDAAATRGMSAAEQRAVEYSQSVAEENQKKDKFNEIVKRADVLFNAGDLESARVVYNEALAVIGSDAYSKSRIASIDNLLAAKEAARVKAIEDGYKKLLALPVQRLIKKITPLQLQISIKHLNLNLMIHL
jgi:tetratricopeptide (TPR) repeat protein